MNKISKPALLTRLLVGFLVCVVLYLLFQMNHITKPVYQCETAIQYTMSDGLLVNGFVLFEETVIEGSGDIGYLVEDGARVYEGQVIAERYTNDSQRLLRVEIEQIEDNIALLEESQDTRGQHVDTLVSERNTALYDLLNATEQGKLSAAKAYAQSYLLAQNQMQIVTGAQSDFSVQLEALYAQKEALIAQLGGLEPIVASTNGYFMRADNAQFMPDTIQTIREKTIPDFATTCVQPVREGTQNVIGKIVSSYTWSFVGTCTAQESERFVAGQTLEITFPYKNTLCVPAKVMEVVVDAEQDVARITLQCEYMGEEVLQLGQEQAKIIFKTYEGLRISTEALRMQKTEIEIEGQESTDESVSLETEEPVKSEEFIDGVYVQYNGLAKFRRVEILFQTPEYTIVPLEPSKDTVSQLKLYDQIIISGVNLADGKVL